ncbi:hypothetical protein D512_18417 [Burkholderia pseudomallei MSHR1043]|uniref:Uncharacterized protein n=1 Tax=Burkholderia mallei (strain NCTC 10229) TaxID=412022 RepID=A2S732_BURM9|nr:hypothetical protein BMA10229_A1772 [Burkholderia mallei NCTC 10229]EDK54295.1 hypothetical protein BMAFMH_B0167 [Burkholderia mallei FMH]EDK59275.1 hypothetical protein BMAJHU_B0165 [Burkholderia mallei JHU]EEC32253.1 ABC transporter, ATP-binding protein [Burkholderia pseudomallei 576]EEH25830.1 ABC transporter, ATP-binding protein [Burkholderia pseudomallei Pakistan 9]EEP86007.1 ABC transporter, ATP-binding protein [Burkholderia mallei GB8 horse 4]EMP75795.1 hypothetical protein D512_184
MMRAARPNDGGGHGPAGSETSRAGITRIGCEGSLSASSRIRPCRLGRPGTREAPLFRRRSLDHKSGNGRKPRAAANSPGARRRWHNAAGNRRAGGIVAARTSPRRSRIKRRLRHARQNPRHSCRARRRPPHVAGLTSGSS